MEYGSTTSTKPQQLSSLCSERATKRGPHQRVIAISLFGPKENKIFRRNASIAYLNQLIVDLNKIYPDNFILRVYHDNTIGLNDVVCPIECANPNVDFCHVPSDSYIPPKIWRFAPVGDPLVDLMMSRDLDSPLTERERAAVNAWLASNKSFHAMRDHPQHGVPMLGGMWGFKISVNRPFGLDIYEKILNPLFITKFSEREDQTFLTKHVWNYAKNDAIVHDSFLCQTSYGKNSVPFPTQRILTNASDCFVGCVRPCCEGGKLPFGECPKACRPLNHQDWILC